MPAGTTDASMQARVEAMEDPPLALGRPKKPSRKWTGGGGRNFRCALRGLARRLRGLGLAAVPLICTGACTKRRLSTCTWLSKSTTSPCVSLRSLSAVRRPTSENTTTTLDLRLRIRSGLSRAKSPSLTSSSEALDGGVELLLMLLVSSATGKLTRSAGSLSRALARRGLTASVPARVRRWVYGTRFSACGVLATDAPPSLAATSTPKKA
mmetsp:Transcript_44127/g.95984  ORF Transcript_44127/g.95984 Transcript_44127/m.95984 type:complete len:210 (+) Transcript_44127:546-1175(+)